MYQVDRLSTIEKNNEADFFLFFWEKVMSHNVTWFDVYTALDWESIRDNGPEEHGRIISSCYCYFLFPSAIPHPWKRPLEDPSLTRQSHVATHDWTWFDRLMQSAWLDLFLSLSLSFPLSRVLFSLWFWHGVSFQKRRQNSF